MTPKPDRTPSAAQGHDPDCASLDRLPDPGPEGEGTFDERGRYQPVCDCGASSAAQDHDKPVPGSQEWIDKHMAVAHDLAIKSANSVTLREIVTTESGERGEWWEDAWRKSEVLAELDKLRLKAERHVVYPLTRDECLALVALAEAALGKANRVDGTASPEIDRG